jgi:DNA-binding NarL/FixJ family response regulator
MRTPGVGVKGDIRILVVDDHPIVRKGLVDLFDEQTGLTVCGQAGTIGQAMAAAASEPPDVAVVDLTLGLESGLELLPLLTASHPAVRVLVLSAHDEKLYAERALKAGALGYVMKDQAAAELIAAVRRVAAGKSHVSADTAERILSTLGAPRRGGADARSPLERLSDREHHVLTLLGQGLATSEIAEKLDISVKTVESHLAHLKEKLGARNGRELMRLAVSWTGAVANHVAPGPQRISGRR